jgi:hypothetical protein
VTGVQTCALPIYADRAYAAWVIDHHLPYRIQAPLAAGFLHVLPEHRQAAGRASWLAALRAYCEAGRYPDEVMRIDRIYRRLRKLAFLDLDLSYAGLPLRLSTSAARWDAADYVGDAGEPEGSPLVSLVHELSHSMHPELHLAPELALVYRLLQERAGPPVRKALDSAKSTEELFTILHAHRSPEACPIAAEVVRAIGRGEYVHLQRLRRPRRKSVPAKVFSARTPQVQARLQKQAGADSLVGVLSHVLGPNGDEVTERLIDFYIRPSIAPADMARTLAAVCAQMARLPTRAARSRRTRPGWGSEAGVLATRLLSLMLSQTERVWLKESPATGVAPVMLVHVRNAEAIELALEVLRPCCRNSPRRHELEVLAGSLRARPLPEFRIIVFHGFAVERKAENSPGDAEFDAAYVDVDAQSATLYLVEAKSTGGSQAAVRQLRRRLRRLGWADASQVVTIEGGAEAAVPVRLRQRG